MRTRFRASRRVRAGFSLFESVIALVIVGMVSIYALNAVGVGFDAAYRARRAIEMDALANQKLDYLNMMQASTFASLPDSLAAGKFDYPNNMYQWQMTSAPYSGQPGVYDVTISIMYLLGSNNVYSVHTYVYRRAAVNSAVGG